MVLPAPGYARLFAFLAPCSIRAASQIDGVMRPAVPYAMINDLDRYRAGWIGFSYDWFEDFWCSLGEVALDVTIVQVFPKVELRLILRPHKAHRAHNFRVPPYISEAQFCPWRHGLESYMR